MSNHEVRSLPGVMAENGRLGDLYKVADDFKQLVRAQKGQVKAIVTTAQVIVRCGMSLGLCTSGSSAQVDVC